MTAQPPDLHTLAAEAIHRRASEVHRDADGDYTLTIHGTAHELAGAILAAVLPAHRRLVLDEAATSWEAGDVWLSDCGESHDLYAARLARRLADDTPATPLSSTQSGQDGPAVAEELRASGLPGGVLSPPCE